jgi:hypothetical protein
MEPQSQAKHPKAVRLQPVAAVPAAQENPSFLHKTHTLMPATIMQCVKCLREAQCPSKGAALKYAHSYNFYRC